MEAVLQPPPPFEFDNSVSNVTSGNLCRSWKNWRKAFNVYFEACELKKKESTVQINILLHVIGPKCREVYDQFSEKFTTLDTVLNKFDTFFQPKKNITVERNKFFCRNQHESESVEQYVFELNKMAASCEFKDLCKDLVRDRLICGLRDSAMRERLLREPDLTLDKALEICKCAEMCRAQANNINRGDAATHHVHEIHQHKQEEGLQCKHSEEAVHWVRGAHCQRCAQPAIASSNAGAAGNQGTRDRRRRGRGRGRGRGPRAAQAPNNNNNPSSGQRPDNTVKCSKCGIKHEFYKCPAYGVQCDNCNRYNHYAKMCKAYYVDGASSEQDSEAA